MSSTVEQIKERLDIVDVVSGYVKLLRAGTNLKAPCPFHSERTPSFVVSPARQSYHCFGCNVHGDIFTFIEEIEGVDFKGALKLLADKAGVEIKYDGPKKTKEELNETDKQFAAMAQAADFFHQKLLDNKEALNYLKERGLQDETISQFKIGFAPDQWHAAEEVLVLAGFTLSTLESVGLSIKGDKGHYDRFRSRIMFPTRDTTGRVVAFSGRIFETEGTAKQSDIQPAKYINSPETELYSKSKILYGYDLAKQTMRKKDFVILVEGQMDLVASHQALYSNTVAISGTALTQDHCRILGRMTHNMVLALDADDAGIKAAGRSAIVALARGFDVKVARLPQGSDPADILQEGGVKQWRGIIKDAKHIIEFLLDVYREKNIDDDRKFKKRVEEVVIPFVQSIQSPIDQEHFVKIVAGSIGVSESAIFNAMKNIKTPHSQEQERVAPAREVNYKHTFSPLSILMNILAWQREVKTPAIDTDSIAEQITQIVGEEEFKKVKEQVTGGDIMHVESMYGDPASVQAVVAERLVHLRESSLRSERLQLTQKLQQAEAAKDKKSIMELSKKIDSLNKQLNR